MPTLFSNNKLGNCKFVSAFCLMVLGAPVLSHAQTHYQPKPPAYQYQDPANGNQAPAQPYAAPQQPAYSANPDWMPQGMSALAQQSSWHTDFTFDRSMLALAGNLYGLDAPTRQSLARLNGITVHSYRFSSSRGYDPAALNAVRAQYDAMGWRHLVSSRSKPGSAGYGNGRTDLWVQTRGMNVAGGAVLLAGPSNVNLIAISGDLSTADLLRLRGHFGIPQFDGDGIPPMH